MKTLTYKLTSNEFSGTAKWFSNKSDAVKAARWQAKYGWSAKVVHAPTESVIFSR